MVGVRRTRGRRLSKLKLDTLSSESVQYGMRISLVKGKRTPMARVYRHNVYIRLRSPEMYLKYDIVNDPESGVNLVYGYDSRRAKWVLQSMRIPREKLDTEEVQDLIRYVMAKTNYGQAPATKEMLSNGRS